MRIISLNKENTSRIAEEVSDILKSGGVAVIPTDTVYGLVADANNIEAVKKIYEIKKRDENKPNPIFAGSIYETKKIAAIGDKMEKFLRKIWPGKVTCVFNKVDAKGTIAIRIPESDFISEIIKLLGASLSQTSANISGKKPHANISELISEFEKLESKPDAIVDFGNIGESAPSTIIDLVGERPKILREGAVNFKEIEKIWEKIQK